MTRRQLDPEAVAIGARIRAARKAKDLGQAELARAIGGQNVSVYRHETGAVRPGLDSIVKYAKHLDVTVEWLMHGGPGGPELEPVTRMVFTRVKASDPNEVPMVIAQLLADGRLGRVTPDEIAFLARQARAEPGLGLDDFEVMLLLRRASSSGSDEDRERLNEALRRQARERNEHEVADLTEEITPPPPKPDSVRKIRPRQPKR